MKNIPKNTEFLPLHRSNKKPSGNENKGKKKKVYLFYRVKSYKTIFVTCNISNILLRLLPKTAHTDSLTCTQHNHSQIHACLHN